MEGAAKNLECQEPTVESAYQGVLVDSPQVAQGALPLFPETGYGSN